MAVPLEIRRVPRPKNTVVSDTGKDSPLRYIVRKVIKVVGKNGKTVRTSGKIIGHIQDFKFYEKKEPSNRRCTLPYGDAKMVYEAGQEIFSELKDSFPLDDACKIFTIAMLRVIKPGVKDKRLSTEYKRSYISRLLAGVHLSKNTVSNFIYELGRCEIEIRDLFYLRLNKVVDTSLVLVDTTYKQDTSKVNSMSQFSYKSKKTGIPGISVLYAYDADNEEPICAHAYPGNFVDTVSCKNFIKTYNLKRGIIVADKGFSKGTIAEITSGKDGFHYISPLKRNAKIIDEHNMLEFNDKFTENPKILFKKKALSNELFLYSFCDLDRKHKETKDFVKNQKVGKFDTVKYQKKLNSFGTIVFASDLDLDPYKVYKSYLERWHIELMFKQYKHDICLNTTNVQSESSIDGSELINFVSTVITSRLVKRFKELGWFDNNSYGEIMSDLQQIRRYDDAPSELMPDKNDQYWGASRENLLDMLVEAGVCSDKLAEPSKTRGRPRKTPVEADKPKRPRGRPKKELSEKTVAKADKPKRKTGRPKSAATLEREAREAEMLARGEVPAKRGRGRPKGSKNKSTLEREAHEAELQAKGELPEKRGPGRPKSTATLEREAREAEMLARGEVPAKRGRGRPKGSKSKTTLEREAREAEMQARGEVPVKRGRGRPMGSRGKKTLEREAREAELRARGELPPKRGAGRPKGSKNKKTLEREAREAELRARGELPPKRGPGRPKGSKNSKTLEREAQDATVQGKKPKKREAEEPAS